ncbi:MAG: tRNA lysidine(34) synthetase TilS, partial [Terasakiella sp.]|nr:tRNA lysidine(34) synthetase TilS [Terasakiella sp.]
MTNFIDRHRLLSPGDTVVVGCSGGADSVALLCVLHALGYRCVAAHCNYHLRGEESNRDMRHVEALAGRLGVDLCVRDFDVDARRASTGESLEMACRELRYGWFDELADRERAAAVAVAHHREDQAETFFLNLLRGTGLRGLGGMAPRRGRVVRPLLDCTRAEIESYIHALGECWVDDSTNAGCDFARNRLRHRLLPLLDELRPGAVGYVVEAMERLREAESFAAD